MVRSLFISGQMARCGIALVDHLKGTDISAHGRDCGSAYNFAPEVTRRRDGTGTIVFAGCGMRRLPCTHCSMPDITMKRESGANGFCGPSPAVLPNSTSSMAFVANAGSRNWNCRGCSGYENSAPVRTGNAAYKQFQLDIFGEVANTLFQCRQAGLRAAEGRRRRRCTGRCLNSWRPRWDRPDDGIWEMRGPRRHFVHSKMMAWVAVDRAIRSAEQGWFSGDIAPMEDATDHHPRTGMSSKASTPASIHLCSITAPNISMPVILMMPLVGFLPADDASRNRHS